MILSDEKMLILLDVNSTIHLVNISDKDNW